VESLALSIIRVAEEHAMKDNTGQVLVQAPVEIANFLLNEKRGALREIEARHDAPIVIVADEQLHTPHYEVTRVRENELGEETSRPSYQRGTPRKLATIALTKANLNVPAAPAVKNVKPAQPAPLREPRPEPVQAAAPMPAPTPAFVARPASHGFMGWLKGLFGGPESAPPPRAPEPRERNDRGERSDRNGQRRDGRGNRQGQGGRDGRDNRRDRDDRRPQQQQAQQGQAKRQDGNKPAQQQQQQQKPKQEKQRQEQQAKSQDPARQQQQPVKEAPKPRTEAVQPVRSEEAANVARNDESVAVAALAPVPVVDPAADAVHAVAEANEATNATEHVAEDGNGEGGSRRRRGRRGGRRRRKQGAEGAAAAGIEDHDADENVAASLQSQPEFDFADAQPTPASVASADRDSADTAVTDGSTQASMTPRAADVTTPPVFESVAVEPLQIDIAATTEPVAPMIENLPVESVAIETAPMAVEPAREAIDPASTPVEVVIVVEAPAVTEPSPMIADADIEPVVPVDETNTDALAVVEPAIASNTEAESESEAKDSREESPLA